MSAWKVVLQIGVAAAMALLAWTQLSDHPLRPVLTMVPLAVVSFSGLDQWLRRLGGEHRGGSVGETSILAILIAASLVGHGLGTLPSSVVVAAFVLLLAVRTARTIIAARSSLKRDSRPSLLFLAIPFLVYCCLLPWSASQRQPDGDEPFYLLVTHSLVDDFDLDLSDDYRRGYERFMSRPIEPQIGDPIGADGEQYSRHSAAVPLLLSPGYAVAGRLGAMAVMAFVSAALAWQILRLGLLSGFRSSGALSSYAVAAFTSPLLVYSGQIWAEVPAALLLAIAFEQLLRATRGELSLERALVLALAIILLPVIKLRFAAISVSIVAVFLLRSKTSRSVTTAIVAALGVGFLALTIMNYARSGRILGIYSLSDLLLAGYTFGEGVRGLAGVFFDCAFGLIPTAPIWVLLLPAGWNLVVRHRRTLVDFLVIAGPYAVAICPRLEWYGGWSPPVRYFVVFLPLAAVALAALFEHLSGSRDGNSQSKPLASGARFVLGATVCATIVLTTMWLVVPGWTYNLADGGNHLLDRYSQRLGLDLVRLFPSFVRVRIASVVWPLCLLLVVPIVMARRRKVSNQEMGGPSAAAWGALSMLVAAGVVPYAAGTLPTFSVEAEDAHVVRRAGVQLFPDQWILQRTRYRGGLTLSEGGSFAAPVVAGGAGVEVFMWVRSVGAGADPVLDIRSGDGAGLSVPITHGRWRRVRAGGFEWTAGAPLVVTAQPSPDQQRRDVIVDRLDLRWNAEQPESE